MKTVDVIAAILLVVGGLNWGMVGLFNFNLVATLFGSIPMLESLVYDLVGLAALWQAFQWKAIQERWRNP